MFVRQIKLRFREIWGSVMRLGGEPEEWGKNEFCAGGMYFRKDIMCLKIDKGRKEQFLQNGTFTTQLPRS